MIAANIVTEVRRLLAEAKHSQRKIARLTGVSRGSIGAIASGKRPDYESSDPSREDEEEEPMGPPMRCGGCGGMVYMPCRFCRTQQAIAANRRLTPRGNAVNALEPLELKLRSEHQARYEEVCNGRREQGIAPREGDRSMFSANGLSTKCVSPPKNGPVPSRVINDYVYESVNP